MTTGDEKPKRSPAEWITFSLASLILAMIVGLVVYTWYTEDNRPPVITVINKEKIREIDGQFYVLFEVINQGGETAESVQVTAELTIDGKVAETGEQYIDFLSSGEQEEGAFVFKKNPRQGELIIRVASYKLP
ncbi:TIGR02588 family protein [Nostoc sp. FACHB-110]|uniref:TIGR02588 family protein n=1 Tax=Nostoc sp. FACHB-110 TaxID=2692834 RepID=UPI0016834DA6|nr:TIGR02588 family protein [Nostoc sp. FACHB-110]MBD2441602.1 TIGR02588 family protein [Nostoc sp. FACHB-110]